MISFLEGTVEYLGDKFVILNTGGIGYKVGIVPKLVNILSKNKTDVNSKIKLFVHSQLNMREGVFDLYGFDTKEGLDLFNLLTTVSGIGPKNAQNIMSSIEPHHLKAAIVNEDPNYLRKISGLGSKIAQRLVLELKNKVDHIDMGNLTGLDLGQEGHAMDALMSLGYTPTQAKEALKDAQGKTLEERVRAALKLLGKK